MDSMFGHSLWNDPFRLDCYDSLLQEQRRRADLARCSVTKQASVDAKCTSDEVQAKSAESKQEIIEKKPKIVYHHFGSWEPKVEEATT